MESAESEVPPEPPNVETRLDARLGKSQKPVPLRLLIDRRLIGIVMGAGKSTLKQICKDTKTKIFDDRIRRGRNGKVVEIGLSIFGKPVNCSYVCHKILTIMKNHYEKLCCRRPIKLRILMSRFYAGRIIGRESSIIKTIMSMTDTKISLSDIFDKSMYDRIITIEGSLGNMCQAEIQISKVLRRSFVNDPDTTAPLFNLNSTSLMMIPIDNNYVGNGFQVNYQSYPPDQYFTTFSSNNLNLFLPPDHLQESVFIFIPVSSIPGIVGILGSNINDIIRVSGAQIQIIPDKVENPIALQQFCHKLNVIGTYKAQWKAQELIFETMWKEGYGPAPEEVILTIEISVLHNQIHHIIGPHGSLAIEMEHETGCSIRLPTNKTSHSSKYSSIHIIGGFIGTQMAQKRIRSILYSTPNQNLIHN